MQFNTAATAAMDRIEPGSTSQGVDLEGSKYASGVLAPEV